jgi:hypothetical protein
VRCIDPSKNGSISQRSNRQRPYRFRIARARTGIADRSGAAISRLCHRLEGIDWPLIDFAIVESPAAFVPETSPTEVAIRFQWKHDVMYVVSLDGTGWERDADFDHKGQTKLVAFQYKSAAVIGQTASALNAVFVDAMIGRFRERLGRSPMSRDGQQKILVFLTTHLKEQPE